MGKFKINKTKTGYTFWLAASNGETIATSEVYKNIASCKKGIASVAKNAPIANIEDQTEKEYAKVKNPKFEIYKDKKGEARFRLKARNGQVIASSEGYASESACKNGIQSVIKNAVSATIEINQ